jgi:hypothetical protein
MKLRFGFAVFQKIASQNYRVLTYKTPFMVENKISQLKELQRHRPRLHGELSTELERVMAH